MLGGKATLVTSWDRSIRCKKQLPSLQGSGLTEDISLPKVAGSSGRRIQAAKGCLPFPSGVARHGVGEVLAHVLPDLRELAGAANAAGRLGFDIHLDALEAVNRALRRTRERRG